LRGDDKVETLSEGISIGGSSGEHYPRRGANGENHLGTISDRIEISSCAGIVGDAKPASGDCSVLSLYTLTLAQIRSLIEKKRTVRSATAKSESVDPELQPLLSRYSDTAQRVIIASSEGTLIEQS